MEILSDATFRGNVDFRGQSFTIYGKDGPIFHANSSANYISEFGNLISNTGIATKSINLRCSTILSNSSDGRYTYTQCLQAKNGTIALTSDCPKVLEKHLVAPADCTLFAVPSDGDFTNIFKNVGFATSVLSYRVDKVWHNGSCTLIDGCFWENTDIDVIMTNGNYNGCPFLIRKAAGLEMTEASYTNKTPGYKLVVTYL